jgi:hypothetical protein
MKNDEKIDQVFKDGLDDFKVAPPAEMKAAIDAQRASVPETEIDQSKSKTIWVFILLAMLFIAGIANLLKPTGGKKHRANSNNATNKHQKDSDIIANSVAIADANTNRLPIENSTNSDETDYVKNGKELTTKHHSFKNTLRKVMKKLSRISTEEKSNFKTNAGYSSSNNIVISIDSVQRKNEVSLLSNQSSDSVALNLIKHSSDTILAISADTISKLDSIAKPIVSGMQAFKKTAKYLFTFEPYFGIGKGFNSISDIQKQTMAGSFADSIQMKSPIYLIGSLFTCKLNSFWISTGIGFMNWKESSAYAYQRLDYLTSIGDSIIIKGSDTIVKRNIPIKTLTKTHQANSNFSHFNYLQLPISLAYSIRKGKFHFQAGLGVQYHLLIASKGNYKNLTDGNVVDYSKSTDAPLRRNYFSGTMHLACRRDLNEQLSIQVRVPLSFGFQSMYTNDFGLRRKLNVMAIQLGITYKL